MTIYTCIFLKLSQTGSVSRAKMSSFTCTFSHATNRWRREGDGENEKEPHKRMQQATVTRFPPQRRELASWLTVAKISVLYQRKSDVRWYLSAREAGTKFCCKLFRPFKVVFVLAVLIKSATTLCCMRAMHCSLCGLCTSRFSVEGLRAPGEGF